MSNLSATLDTQVLTSITKPPKQRKARTTTPKANKAPKVPTTPKNAPKASKTVVLPIEQASKIVVDFATMTPEQFKVVQKRMTEEKKRIAPTPPTPAHRVARRDESKDIMSKLLGMNKAYNEIKKRYDANKAYFVPFAEKPELLNVDRIVSLMTTLKKLVIFFKADKVQLTPTDILNKVVVLACMKQSDFDSLRIRAEKLRKATK